MIRMRDLHGLTERLSVRSVRGMGPVKRDAEALKAQFAGYFAPAAENREAA